TEHYGVAAALECDSRRHEPRRPPAGVARSRETLFRLAASASQRRSRPYRFGSSARASGAELIGRKGALRFAVYSPLVAISGSGAVATIRVDAFRPPARRARHAALARRSGGTPWRSAGGHQC